MEMMIPTGNIQRGSHAFAWLTSDCNPPTYAFFFSVLRFEIITYTLSHSTSPFFVKGFS
jgi:hypothetical protein